MVNAKERHRKQQDLPERVQAWLGLLSASLLSSDELLKLIQQIIELIRFVH